MTYGSDQLVNVCLRRCALMNIINPWSAILCHCVEISECVKNYKELRSSEMINLVKVNNRQPDGLGGVRTREQPLSERYRDTSPERPRHG